MKRILLFTFILIGSLVLFACNKTTTTTSQTTTTTTSTTTTTTTTWWWTPPTAPPTRSFPSSGRASTPIWPTPLGTGIRNCCNRSMNEKRLSLTRKSQRQPFSMGRWTVYQSSTTDFFLPFFFRGYSRMRMTKSRLMASSFPSFSTRMAPSVTSLMTPTY